jgi:DNA-directed RNA polymerase specialized sigma24 family protein
MISDEALHERLLRGDLGAFDALYERHERPLFGFILHHLTDRHEAEDVLHDAFLAVLREREADRAVSCFRAWIYQIARNLRLNRQRSNRRAARFAAAAVLVAMITVGVLATGPGAMPRGWTTVSQPASGNAPSR